LFAIIDIETTGNSYKHGQITEIAIFQHNGTEVTDSFSSLVKPDMDIPLFITRLTGISNEMVKNAPHFYEIARKVVEMTAGRIFVAHNVHFDYKFVQEEFKRLGYDFNRKTLCTVQLSRKLLPGHKSYSLGKLCSEKGIEINGRHRAAGDALATVKLFELLLKENEIRNNSDALKNLKLF
jgi:DNA polymerase III subunit epsilon